MENKNHKVCVDTDILIDLLRNVPHVVNSFKKLENKNAEFSTTAINSFELYYGAYKTKKKERNIQSVKELLGRLTLLKIDMEVSEKAGEIAVELEKKGHPIEFRDILIGCAALVNGFSMFTQNIEHFKRIPYLNIIKGP